MTSIKEIITEYNLDTDKANAHNYELFYDRLFAEYGKENIRLLELGIQSGASCVLWCKLFPNAEIIGIDIGNLGSDRNRAMIDFERTKLIMADAYSKDVADSIEGEFDFIIDDGSHKLEDMISMIDLYRGKLRLGGYLIIEDITAWEWTHSLTEKLSDGYICEAFDYRRMPPYKNQDFILSIKRVA